MNKLEKVITELKTKDTSPEFYKHYPLLFHSYFPDVKQELVNDLSQAGYVYYHSVLKLDAVFDKNELSGIAEMMSLQEETIKILTSIYGKESDFWYYWNMRKSMFFQAVRLEKSLQKTDKNWEVYEKLADFKSAFGKVAIDGLYVLSDDSNKKNTHFTLIKSHSLFSTGFQLYDDLKDFAEDFGSGQFNMAEYLLSKEVDFSHYNNDVSILNKLLYSKNIWSKILNDSADCFNKALQLVNTLNKESDWTACIKKMIKTVSAYKEIVEGSIKVLEKRQQLKKEKQTGKAFFEIDKIEMLWLKKGLNFVKNDFENNYAELKHIMYLGKLDDFDNEIDIHVSDTFQRAMLNECLVDISLNANLDIASFVKEEIEYLLLRRNQDNLGGWKYFPTVGEIAPDIDDLAQMMLFFIKSGNHELVKQYCIKAIDTALQNPNNKNGGIGTWIIPNKNRTPIQEKQILFNNTKWGTGPDVEVVANFLYVLHLFDKHTFGEIIRAGIQYLINEQSEAGCWASRWYYGNYYGTYVCLRILKEYEDMAVNSIKKALDFLKTNQNKDGGFGGNCISDPLSSSFALKSLKIVDERKEHDISRTVSYLIKTQLDDGSWSTVNFIKPKVLEPYKSKVLTTGLVLNALIS